MGDNASTSLFLSLNDEQKDIIKQKIKNEIYELDIPDNLKDDDTLFVCNIV